ncbi:hypothetical protein [Aquamicrobium terrae]|uniref:Lipoprotein n=1 Tax=Aquamicrobium terrae TaxID=1324945 RepID=A0ABV2N5S2_9HYPH
MSRASLSTVLFVALALAACNSSSVLDPSAIGTPGQTATAQPPTGQPSTGQPPASDNAASSSAAAVQPPARPGRIRLQVAPIVGTSVEAAGPLLEELQQRARQRGVTLAGSSDQSATHVLKGYFSVLNEDGAATVIYVWDVYDPAGSRLHRISGQQKATAVNGAEGWPGVGPDTLKAIADTTMDQLSTWFDSAPGQG